ELIRRWDHLGSRWKEIIASRSERMLAALRDALVSEDPTLGAHACYATVWIREYDLAPLLINLAESADHPHRDLAAQSLLELAELLYEELASPYSPVHGGDPNVKRTRMIAALEKSLERWPHHHRREVLEAFLLLCPRDHALVKQVLNNPHDPTYLHVIDLLAQSRQPGIMRLLLSYLDDRRAPSAALQTLARRSDKIFVARLLKKIGFEPTAAARRNLKKIRDFPWMHEDPARLDALDDAGQHAVVQMAVLSSMKRDDVLPMLERLLRSGKPGGRRAAAEGLSDFQGAEANELLLDALADDDPLVQVAAMSRLRQRSLPGSMPRLLELLESEHETVRGAARNCLSEFSCTRFLAAFDMLTPEARHSTGKLVGKIDLQAFQTLREELTSGVRGRIFRAMDAAVVIGVVADLEEPLLVLLKSDDYLYRAKAAETLRHCGSDKSRQALRERLLDPHQAVQQAVEASLLHLSRTAAAPPPPPTADPTPLLSDVPSFFSPAAE
ncbi:MAG: HEAT repeat domain-containing protein, partial [Planctomycetes bacterium]|nr:HEAT repeat domain-containing protein [Planctomycetota bacterium]